MLPLPCLVPVMLRRGVEFFSIATGDRSIHETKLELAWKRAPCASGDQREVVFNTELYSANSRYSRVITASDLTTVLAEFLVRGARLWT